MAKKRLNQEIGNQLAIEKQLVVESRVGEAEARVIEAANTDVDELLPDPVELKTPAKKLR